MIAWKNMDTLVSYQELENAARVNLATAMAGENGAERVKRYSVPMGEGLDFNFGARPVDDEILSILAKEGKTVFQMNNFMNHNVPPDQFNSNTAISRGWKQPVFFSLWP